MSIEATVKKLIAKQSGLDLKDINQDDEITGHLGLDSLDIVELMMVLEEAFDINIADEAFGGQKTVQQVIDYVKTQKGVTA